MKLTRFICVFVRENAGISVVYPFESVDWLKSALDALVAVTLSNGIHSFSIHMQSANTHELLLVLSLFLSHSLWPFRDSRLAMKTCKKEQVKWKIWCCDCVSLSSIDCGTTALVESALTFSCHNIEFAAFFLRLNVSYAPKFDNFATTKFLFLFLVWFIFYLLFFVLHSNIHHFDFFSRKMDGEKKEKLSDEEMDIVAPPNPKMVERLAAMRHKFDSAKLRDMLREVK